MNVLLDTNLLTRMAQPGHPHHRAALDAADALLLRGDRPCLVPQVLYEFWVVATRPAPQNGLGLSVAWAAAELARIRALFPLLHDSPAIFGEWGTARHHPRRGGQGGTRCPDRRGDDRARVDTPAHLQRRGFCPLPRNHN